MNNRIIAIDDEQSILRDYQYILTSMDKDNPDLVETKVRLAIELFGESLEPDSSTGLEDSFVLETAGSGMQGFEIVKKAFEDGNPFAVAFIDIRMPPGWDGVQTAKMIRKIDKDIEIVIVTAYSDHKRVDIIQEVGMPEKLLYIKKPFDPDEIKQLALCLTRKWGLEQHQKNINVELEKRVQERTHQIEMANQELVKSAEVSEKRALAKSEFLAKMSHDIRTPMHSILGVADLLWDSPLNREQKNWVKIFKRSGDALLCLINDILDLSKIEADRLNLDEIDFNLRKIIEQILEVLAIKAHRKGLELLYEIEPDVPLDWVGDPVRLSQVFSNLIGNAIKFTDKGEILVRVERVDKEVELSSDMEPLEKSRIKFSVHDTGIGIPLEQQRDIFDNFSQICGNGNREYEGTGLGLNICKKLVKMMDGDIWVQSAPGQGSTFYFSLSFHRAKHLPVAEDLFKPNAYAGHVLIVDDNLTCLTILNHSLTLVGLTVTQAQGEHTALEMIDVAQRADKNYELIFIDSVLNGAQGVEVAQKIRNKIGDKGRIIMLFRASDDSTTIQMAQQHGVDDYLIKPIKYKELEKVINLAVDPQTIQNPKEDNQKTLPGAVSPDQPLKILLVEDYKHNQFIFTSFLKVTPHDIDIAENGAVAVDKIKQNSYDLVFMDMEMPVMNGYEASRTIREWEVKKGRKPTPIIALTAHATKGKEMECIQAGCTAYIPKPFNKKTIIETIEKHRPV